MLVSYLLTFRRAGADEELGMANRLCFDLGLHLDCQNDGLPDKEIQIRHMTLFACVIYDK